MSIGGITYKKINGKRYAYYQWCEDGKQRSRRVKDDELESLVAQIELAKSQAVLERSMELSDGRAVYSAQPLSVFKTDVKTGVLLENFSDPVKGFKKRECFAALHDYVYGANNDRVLVLYGLRRTGKTTLVRQLIGEMDAAHRAKTAFVQVNTRHTLADVNHDLKLLESQGFKYVFVDEVTQLGDFIEGAALFSDVFAVGGMKIVLSGTDSLGFVFSEDEQLYDRCILLHTTFIPYREFERVLGVVGIDEFIRYGGTMSMGGTNYNKDAFTFATKKGADDYVDSAIARNIQHSLKCYQYGGHFRSLQQLYERGELTNAINRIVEDINHRFTLDVLTRDFASSDLKISVSNLRRDRMHPTDALDKVNAVAVAQEMKRLLEIMDRNECSVDIEDAHRVEIREYLQMLDMICPIDVVNMASLNQNAFRTVLAQPGLRYAQSEALVRGLMMDEVFQKISIGERNRIIARILDEIRGRMMEEIVLLETKMARPDRQIFTLQFPVGEFDMVVFDSENACCEIYEIKHSDKAVPAQCRHLQDKKKCHETEFRYGKIKGRYVIYRGKSCRQDDIEYLNVEEYLKDLG